jgi:hypothetical protein
MGMRAFAVALFLGGIVGWLMIVAGVAMISTPAALIVAGIPLVAAGYVGLLRIDIEGRR